MRKKIINGLLLAVTFVAMSALVSCKDYAEDYYNELRGAIADQNFTLQTLQNGQIATLQSQIAALQALVGALPTNIATQQDLLDLETKLKNAMNDLKCNYTPEERQLLHDSIAILQKEKADKEAMLLADQLLQAAIDALAAKEKADSLTLANSIDALAAKEKADSLTLADSINAANQRALEAAALAAEAKKIAEGKADTAFVNALAKTVEELNKAVITLDARLTQVEADAAEALALAIRDSIRIKADSLLFAGRLDVLEGDMKEAKDSIEQHAKDIAQAKKDIEQAKKDIEQNTKDIEQNAKDLAEAKEKYDNALKVINEALASLQKQINNLPTGTSEGGLTLAEVQAYMAPIVNGLQNQIDEITDDLKALKKKLNKVLEDMSKQIKNIILQGAVSPVVGYFALPVGVQSNILAAYYGEPAANGGTGDVYFPSDRDASYVFAKEKISDEAFNVIGGKGVVTKTTYNKYIMDESEGNAGTLYLTINPAEVDFSGITPKLVNSRDKESGVTLSAITPSNKTLYFGYTRAERVYNGFYEAKATIDPAKVEEVKPSFDIESLKPLAKQILNKEIDLTNIYYTVQDQLKDVLVRNGVKVEWTDTLGDHQVYSDYSVAATAIPALSFKFLADGVSKSIPTITPIGALDVDVKLNLTYSSVGTIEYELGDVYVVYGGVQYNVQGLDGINGLIAQLNNTYADLNYDINHLIDQIKNQVNSNVDDIEGKINDEYIDRVSNVIGKVNKLIKKVNTYLLNPNHLLQPFLAYESDGAYHHMSMSRIIPTEFKFGTGNAIELIPTSYTAEVLAPAYQKFVAVTNVIAPDFSVSAQGGDATCQALADYVNKEANFMNTVIPGKQTGIVFAPDPSHKEGYIYEITYAAVDYTGYNVAKKFYVRVK